MSAISFNEKDKTFRLYFGNSLYAFCITPELSLEHLYWGKSLNKEFDLRYLSQSSRMLPFLTSDETINRIKSVDKSDETLETLQEEWQLSTISSFGKYAESETIKKKRLENIKWRKMAMKLFATKATSNIFPTIDIKPISIDDSSFQSTSLPVTPLRRRAVSNAPISMAEGLRPPSISNIRSLMKSLPSSPRGSKSFIDLKFSTISQLPTVQSIESELPRLKPTPLAPEIFDRMVGKIGKGAICTEYSDHGTGDFRSPSFLVVSNDDGSSISPLKYKRHRIFGGKENLPDNLPSLRIIDPEDATTLIITMGDVGSGVEVDLVYGTFSY